MATCAQVILCMCSVFCHDALASNPTGGMKRSHSRKLVHRRRHVWRAMLHPIPGEPLCRYLVVASLENGALRVLVMFIGICREIF